MKKSTNRRVLLALILLVTAVVLSGCLYIGKTHETDVDWSLRENWAFFGDGENKEADLFIICPTVDMGKGGNYNMDMTNAKRRASFIGALNMEKGIYDEVCSIYAPFYRQATFPVYYMSEEESQTYFDIAYNDVASAFEYYMLNVNDGRPFILAGFSQGSQMALRLLEEYADKSFYSRNLIAAYLIGWRVTDEDLETYPHIKMAEGESDTGVIIAFNSEDPDITESLIVPANVKTYAINPLNWKTDSTQADKSLNKGACFVDYSGIVSEIKEFCGAYIDPVRGTLKVVGVDSSKYPGSLFPDGIYHIYDYQFFYRNLQENVKVRTQAFLNKRAA